MDMARRDGIRIDVEKLRAELGCVGHADFRAQTEREFTN